jgi:hypothetical protein
MVETCVSQIKMIVLFNKDKGDGGGMLNPNAFAFDCP